MKDSKPKAKLLIPQNVQAQLVSLYGDADKILNIKVVTMGFRQPAASARIPF